MIRSLMISIAAWSAIAFAMITQAAPQNVRLASRNSYGEAGNDESRNPTISANGKVIFFTCDATNLIINDSNQVEDVYTAAWPFSYCERQSVTWNGGETLQPSYNATGISADGRYVVFISQADDIVQNDNNGYADTFIRDRWRGTTALASVNEEGDQANLSSRFAALSLDGQYVIFSTASSNLVDDDRNQTHDVFVKNMRNGEVSLVSIASDGTQGNDRSGEAPHQASAQASVIAFESKASNLVSNDTNKRIDVFVHDRETATTSRVSVGPRNEQARLQSSLGGMSADGRFVTFTTAAYSFEDGFDENSYVFLRDLHKNTTTLVSLNNKGERPNRGAGRSSLSATGRFMAFPSSSTNLDDRCTDGTAQIYVLDRQTGKSALVSCDDQGNAGDDHSAAPRISASGRFIAFHSRASNFADVETHGVYQVYIADMGCDWFLRGDSNNDGEITSDDIDAFVLALIDETQYILTYLGADWECNNDINRDGKVDFDDIDPFVECLVNGGCE
jgi:hypothetical protein